MLNEEQQTVLDEVVRALNAAYHFPLAQQLRGVFAASAEPADATIGVQEAWEAVGGNPGIKATREQLVTALKLMDGANDAADALGDLARDAFAHLQSGDLDKTRETLAKAVKVTYEGAAPAEGWEAVDEREAFVEWLTGYLHAYGDAPLDICKRVASNNADGDRGNPIVWAAWQARAALATAKTKSDAPAERCLDEDVARMLAALPWSDRSADADPIGKAKRVVSSMLANEAMASSTDLSCVLSVINSLAVVDAGLLADKARLDSGVIVTSESNEFGETYKCERRGNDLRAMIDEGMRLAARDRAAKEGA